MFKRLMQQVDRLLGRGVIDDRLYDELEEALVQADTHIQIAGEILNELRKAIREEKITTPDGIKQRLQYLIANRFRVQGAADLTICSSKPTVVLFVGVNGVGKTTTIAKVAYMLKKRGHSVLLAAGDTFRAAAIEQLEVWAGRIGCEVVRNQQGSDSGAVVFDAISAAKARGIDYAA